MRVDALFTALWDNTDSDDAAAARRVLDGRYAFVEDGILRDDDDLPWVASWASGPTRTENVRRRIDR